MVSRAERTPFSAWWWTVDRLMLAALGAIMLGGIILSLAASPPVAARIGLDPFYFVNRHILYLIPTMIVLLATSFLSSRQIRRIALIVFIVSFVMVIATLFVGAEVKGARRWAPSCWAGSSCRSPRAPRWRRGSGSIPSISSTATSSI